MTKQHVYFISDFHLGAPNYEKSLEREKKIVRFLTSVECNAKEIILLGDLFDFWYEYKHAVPKGFVRLFAKIIDLQEKGIVISVFTGNHDIWMFDYLEKELGVKIYREPQDRVFGNKKFHIAHGDGLGPGDHGFKFIKSIFTNKFCQKLFQLVHPDLGITIANLWSRHSRDQNIENDTISFKGEDKEFLILYSKEILSKEHFDYFVFGHRHLNLTIPLSDKSTYFNIGDWLTLFTYGEFDGENFSVKAYVEN